MNTKFGLETERVHVNLASNYTEAELAWLRKFVIDSRDSEFRSAQIRRNLLRAGQSLPSYLVSQRLMELISDFAPPSGTKGNPSKLDLQILLREISKAERQTSLEAYKTILVRNDRKILSKVHLQIGLIVVGSFVAFALFLWSLFWKYETFGYWTFDSRW